MLSDGKNERVWILCIVGEGYKNHPGSFAKSNIFQANRSYLSYKPNIYVS